jgi:prepilin peptidase CpaA
MNFPMPIYILGLLQLLIISWIDLKTLKISNWWILFNLLVYVALIFIFPQLYAFNVATWLYPLGFILVGFPLFLLGIMGAGDSKFLAGLFLIIPVGLQHIFFMKLIGSTVSCALILLIIRVVRNYSLVTWVFKTGQWAELKQLKGSRFSYAPVILLAWLWLMTNVL